MYSELVYFPFLYIIALNFICCKPYDFDGLMNTAIRIMLIWKIHQFML